MTTMRSESSVIIQYSVYTGDTYSSTFVNQQNYYQNIIIGAQENSVLQKLDKKSEQHTSPVKPSKQLWFMGKRIWNPQTHMIFVSLMCMVVFQFFLEPVLALAAENLIALYTIKKGDFRGIFPLILGIALFTIFVIP